MLLMGVALFAFVSVVFPADRTIFIFLLGTYAASVPWGLWNVAVIMGGGATWRAGAEAERWTGSELGRLGPRWCVEHGIPLSGKQSRPWKADVDHVAIGPYGVLVAETKFTTNDMDLASEPPDKRVHEASVQVERNVRDLKSILGADQSIPFIPMVIWWGPGVVPIATVIRRDGDTRVVRGIDADQWRTRIAAGGDRVSEEDIGLLTTRLREHVHQELVGKPTPKELENGS